MKELFCDTGSKLLEALTFTRSLFAFDFDGTLAPIVKDPHGAKISPRTKDLLLRLSKTHAVAVISGRSVSDLKKRVAIPGVYLIGNHGMEGLDARNDAVTAAHNLCLTWKTALEKKSALFKADTGLSLEDKGFSLALHYRNSRNKKEAKAALFAAMSTLDPSPRVIPGKCVLNLVPPGAPHKGIALLELMARTSTNAALYVGDDDTDEDIFSLPDARITSVRVGRKAQSQARFFLKSQPDINKLMRCLLPTR